MEVSFIVQVHSAGYRQWITTWITCPGPLNLIIQTAFCETTVVLHLKSAVRSICCQIFWISSIPCSFPLFNIPNQCVYVGTSAAHENYWNESYLAPYDYLSTWTTSGSNCHANVIIGAMEDTRCSEKLTDEPEGGQVGTRGLKGRKVAVVW